MSECMDKKKRLYLKIFFMKDIYTVFIVKPQVSEGISVLSYLSHFEENIVRNKFSESSTLS